MGKLTRIPSDGKVNAEDLSFYDGFCEICDEKISFLKTHFQIHKKQLEKYDCVYPLLKRIPEDGNIRVDELKNIVPDGFCGICDEPQKMLQFHFVHVHQCQLEKYGYVFKLVREIPEDLDVIPHHLTTYKGYCKKCKKDCGQLQSHFRGQHTERKNGTYKYKYIPADGKAKIKEIYSLKGDCLIPKCADKKSKDKLREHFVNVHVKETVPCPECNKDVIKISLQAHRETHSGPAMCLKCESKHDSVVGVRRHIRRYHEDTTPKEGINFRKLTPEEATDFEIWKEKCRLAREARGTTRQQIPTIKKTLEDYEKKLANPADELSQRCQMLKDELRSLVRDSPSMPTTYNAAFIATYDSRYKIPKMVFEVIEEHNEYDLMYEASSFRSDPKMKCDQAKEADFKHAFKEGDRWVSYHRTHVVAARNYRNMLLVACTYYYTNTFPGFPEFNTTMRAYLEAHLRYLANRYGKAKVFHFLFMKRNPDTTETGVGVPESIATVCIVEGRDGKRIYGWWCWNQQAEYDYNDCEKDPFFIFQQARVVPTFSREDFVYVSEDVL